MAVNWQFSTRACHSPSQFGFIDVGFLYQIVRLIQTKQSGYSAAANKIKIAYRLNLLREPGPESAFLAHRVAVGLWFFYD